MIQMRIPPSIQILAFIAMRRARAMTKFGPVDMSAIIHQLAEEYDVDPSEIARGLNERKVYKYKKCFEAQEAQYREILEQERRKKNLHDAYIHELALIRGFRLANHMSDYK